MSGAPETGHPGLDALMTRMLGGLLLGGAAVLLAVALLLAGLPRAAAGDLVLPGGGGRHLLSAAALPVLFGGSLLMGVPGLVATMWGGRPIRFRAALRSPVRSGPAWRPALVLLAGGGALALALLRR